MADHNSIEADREPVMDPTEDITSAESKPAVKGRKAFAKIRREITDDELQTPAVQRMLMDEIDRLERENLELIVFRDKFHSANRKVAILEEQAKKSRADEIIFTACIALGVGAISYAASVWSEQPTGLVSMIFGGLLVLLGIASRVVQR